MPVEPRVLELVNEILETERSPEEICAGCPELLPEVRRQWKRFVRIDSQLAAMFPSSDSIATARERQAHLHNGDLPQVPGYEMEFVLGHGGMGMVYKARHLRLNRPVALKMMIYGACATSVELARFQREAEAVARLRHPHIVQIYDVGDADGRPYFTMEFVEGGTLARKLGGNPQPALAAASLAATLAEAVQAAHDGGIVHRDLKPANILLTSEGTPKISDFGLARRCNGDFTITLSGATGGTPSYMAPEQALGTASAFSPSVDIYSLGALLYELLTGRPPFRAETATETLRQVISQDPVPPSRLNAAVPRDAETICLKCLEKEPQRRYASAAALAEDLQRFRRNEPIVARPVGPLERGFRWIRRKPTAAALVATALALIALAIGGGVSIVQQQAERRAELRTEVGTAVAQAVSLRKRFHFHEARTLLEQARQRLKPAAPDDLREQVTKARGELELAENLDTARLRAAAPVEGRFDTAGTESLYAESLYEETFATAGLGGPGDDSDVAATQVRNSTVRAELVAALDDWASITPDKARRAWLLAVARGADQDALRDRLRQPELWDDGPGLTKLLKELPVDELSPHSITALGRVLLKTGGDAVPLLSAAQARYPQNFWLNFELGWALFVSRRSDEALGFYRAALALRPEASSAHNGVGVTLGALGRLDEAIGHFEQALNIDPNFAMVHSNLGLALWAKGRQDEAIRHYQEAIRLDPKVSATAHHNPDEALRRKGRLDEAIGHYQEAVPLDPKASAAAHNNLGEALRSKGRLDEAISHYQESIQLDPKASALAHNNLSAALYQKGRLDEAISHLQESIRLDPKASATVHYNLGMALRDKGRMDEAIGRFEQALRLEPNSILACEALFTCRNAAARAALQASRETPLQEERIGLRRQALDWLRAGLELRAQLVKEGKAVEWSLTALQTDPALADVRDHAALTKLPDGEREQWQRLWADVAAQLAADPVEQGRVHAARRDWAGAADYYGRSLGLGATDDGHLWFEYAAVLILSGDRAGYVEACTRMVERYGKAPNLRAYHVARACTLAPDAVPDASLPGRLAEKELQAAAQTFWSLTEQGALHYRAGRFPEAVAVFEQSLRVDATPGKAVLNWLWLSLAQQRLGRPEEARRWLGTATTWLDRFGDGMPTLGEEELGLHLHNWLEAHVLRREAEALIRPADAR